MGYRVLPQGIRVLVGFTPAAADSLVDFDEFFGFVVRMLLVFGAAFQIPLFAVLLNLAGVVSGRSLGRHWPWIVLATMIFAAVATPSTDPFSILMLAVPLLALFLVAEVVARVVDRLRDRGMRLAPRREHRRAGAPGRFGPPEVTSPRLAGKRWKTGTLHERDRRVCPGRLRPVPRRPPQHAPAGAQQV